MSPNLECFLIYNPSLIRVNELMKEVLEHFEHQGKVDISIVENEEYFAPKSINTLSGLRLEGINEISFSTIVPLFDINEKCRVDFILDENMVRISTPESFILDKKVGINSHKERLTKFYALCKMVVNIKKPGYMVIGTEAHSPENLVYSKLKVSEEHRAFAMSDFDENQMIELLNWYNAEYSRI